jgi:predicted dehydrogenase
MDRRNFLMSSAAALGATSSVFASPGDTVRVGVIGVGGKGKALGGRGKDHLTSLVKLPNVEVAAVADVDQTHLDYGVGLVEKATGKKPKGFADFRRMLDDKSIDAVTIATPNHWHTLMTILACQAGKDVYVEKPCSHNIFEAKQVVAAARKYNRMVQQGSQIRSAAGVQEAVQQMRDGLIGDVYLARGLCYKWRDTIGRTPPSPVPAGVDYDLWTGPAPKREFTENRFHYNWHWFWDYGNGDLGNQGTHQVDMARWGLGVKYPTKITATGSHFMFDDDQETPNTLNVSFEFNEGGAKKMIVFEVRHWISNHEAAIGEPRPGNSVGAVFYGSKGYMSIWDEDTNRYASWIGREQKPGPGVAAPELTGKHWANFIDVVRSRKQADLTAPIEEGAISMALVHLANISYRVGRMLHFDAAKYSCIGDAEANRMFTRNYRKPFVVPEKV